MSWDSVTRPDPPAVPPVDQPVDQSNDPSDPSFQFDLGSALARLGLGPDLAPEPPSVTQPTAPPPPVPPPPPPAAPAPAPLAPPVPASAALPRRDVPAPLPDLPQREVPTPSLPASLAPSSLPTVPVPSASVQSTPVVDLPQRETPANATLVAEPSVTDPPAYDPAPGRSVFDGANPAPALPRNPQRVPSAEPLAPRLPTAGSTPIPTLPAANPIPVVPVVAAESTTSPSGQTDVQAVRSFQRQAARQRRQSRLLGKSFLVVVLLAALIGAAMYVGRDLLFPAQWDPELTPLADEVQLARGAEFTEPVALATVPAAEYATLALGLTVGDDWDDRLPEWRALGLANGTTEADAVTAAVVEWRAAIYDPSNATIYRADGGGDTSADLRLSLEEAFDHQHSEQPSDADAVEAVEDAELPEPTGVTWVSSSEAVASAAVERARLVGSEEPPEFDADVQVPLPLLSEFVAIDVLGEPILDAGFDADESGAIDSGSPKAAMGAIPSGTKPLGDVISLGEDGWWLVWQNRLPNGSVSRLDGLIDANAYRPITQESTVCFLATFQTASDVAAGEVATLLGQWAAAGPVEAAATISISAVDPARVELQACDPGTAVDQPVDASAVTALIERQLGRLG